MTRLRMGGRGPLMDFSLTPVQGLAAMIFRPQAWSNSLDAEVRMRFDTVQVRLQSVSIATMSMDVTRCTGRAPM